MIDPRCYRNRCHVYSLYWTSDSVRPDPPNEELCNINYTILQLPTSDIPTADNIIITADRTISGDCSLDEQLQEALFTFTDEFGGTLNAVKILTVPSSGYLTVGAVIVSAGDVVLVPEDFTTGLYYHTDDTVSPAYDDEFLFQLKTAESEIYSNVGTATINVSLCTNSGPVATDNTIPVDRISTTSCLVTEEYTDGTIFTFSDADGDLLNSVKIMSLPTNGTLRYGQFDFVEVNDILDFTTEVLYYISDSSIETAYQDTADFQVRTDGNGVFSNTATLTFDVTICTNINDLPVATDNTVNIDRLTAGTCLMNIIIPELDFPYTDTEGDALNGIKIVSLPSTGTFTLGESTVINAGDIIEIPKGEDFYYHTDPTDQGSYIDTIQFQVRTEENLEFSNIATLTITVTECVDSYTPCITYEPHFDVSSGGIGLLDVGTLMSDTAVVGEYVIEWRFGSTEGGLVLVSASSNAATDTDIQVYHSPSNFPVPLAAGTYYPVLRWVEIDGIVYHSDPDLGDRFGEDLAECVDLIEVLQPIVVQNLTCANGTTSTDSDYDHMVEYANEDNPPENAAASLTFDLNDDGSTKYLAWSFWGYTVSDKVSFYYEDISGNRTLIESAIIGSDVSGCDFTTNEVEVDFIKFDSAVNLTSFPYVFGDRVHIEVTPSAKQPSNKNTNWKIYLKCLGDVFGCDYIDDDWWTIDPCSLTSTYNETACRLEVNVSTLGNLLSSAERTYLSPSVFSSGSLYANFNTNAGYYYTSSYGSCTDTPGTITYTKSGNTLTIVFTDSGTYEGWKTEYNSNIASLDSNGYTANVTDYAHYMYIRLYTYHGATVDTQCGDSTNQSNISFHRSAVPNFTDGTLTVTITQAASIVNGTTNYPCDDTYEEINSHLGNMNAMIDRVEGWTVTTKMRHSGYMAGRYINVAIVSEPTKDLLETLRYPTWNIDKICGTPPWPHTIGVYGSVEPYYEFVRRALRLNVTDTTNSVTIANNFEVWDKTVNHAVAVAPEEWTLIYKIVDGEITDTTCEAWVPVEEFIPLTGSTPWTLTDNSPGCGDSIYGLTPGFIGASYYAPAIAAADIEYIDITYIYQDIGLEFIYNHSGMHVGDRVNVVGGNWEHGFLSSSRPNGDGNTLGGIMRFRIKEVGQPLRTEEAELILWREDCI